jgi:hypothetical protein
VTTVYPRVSCARGRVRLTSIDYAVCGADAAWFAFAH